MHAHRHIPVRADVCLTELGAEDTPALVEYLNDEEIYRCTLRIPRPYTATDAAAFLALAQSAAQEYGHPVHFAIRDRAGRLLGGCGFDALIVGHRAEIGYWLARPFWGRGIMTDVVHSACQFALNKWQLVRIAAFVFDFNARSARVLEKNGFVLEGILRKQHRKDDRFVDTLLFALT